MGQYKIGQKAYKASYYSRNREKCRAQGRIWYAANKEHIREYEKKRRLEQREHVAATERARSLKKTYGISMEQYNSLSTNQNGVCAICGNVCPSGNNLAVDHCHTTKEVRGLLCWQCNRAIGLLKDSPDLCYSASVYLTKELKVA